MHDIMAHQAQVDAVVDGTDEGIDVLAAARLSGNHMMRPVDQVVQRHPAMGTQPILTKERLLLDLPSEIVAPHGLLVLQTTAKAYRLDKQIARVSTTLD